MPGYLGQEEFSTKLSSPESNGPERGVNGKCAVQNRLQQLLFYSPMSKMTFFFNRTDKGRVRNITAPMSFSAVDNEEEENKRRFLEISYFADTRNCPLQNSWVFLSGQALSLGYKYVTKVPDHKVYKLCEGRITV